MERHSVGLWGEGQNFLTLAKAMGGIPDKNWTMLDISDYKHCQTVCGKIVKSPKEIPELGIDCIIEFTGYSRLDILNVVKREFPEVEKIYSVYELPIYEE